MISHHDVIGKDLRVTKCGNAACSAGNVSTIVDAVGDVGHWSSITIAPDSLPVISYFDLTSADLKVARCGNAACSSGNTLAIVDSAGDVGRLSSITIGTDGLPIVSYLAIASNDLKVAGCSDAACAAAARIVTVDAGSAAGRTSIGIAPDGLPVIAYGATGSEVKVVKCGSPLCLTNWVRR